MLLFCFPKKCHTKTSLCEKFKTFNKAKFKRQVSSAMWTHFTFLGPLHTRHFGTQYYNEKIKRYFDKKIKWHFSSKFFFPVWIENIYFCLFENILKCNYNILKKKLSLYFNIFLLQYCVQKMLCATSALGLTHLTFLHSYLDTQ